MLCSTLQTELSRIAKVSKMIAVVTTGFRQQIMTIVIKPQKPKAS